MHKIKRIQRHKKVRKNVVGTSLRPRIAVFKSGQHIYAQIIDDQKRVTYLECKTYNLKNIKTTQRAFYFSPSLEGCKITSDARHLVLSFQIEKKSSSVYIPVHWRIYSIDSLTVQIKHEFNADNRQIYREEALLCEGEM